MKRFIVIASLMAVFLAAQVGIQQKNRIPLVVSKRNLISFYPSVVNRNSRRLALTKDAVTYSYPNMPNFVESRGRYAVATDQSKVKLLPCER